MRMHASEHHTRFWPVKRAVTNQAMLIRAPDCVLMLNPMFVAASARAGVAAR